MAEVVDLVDANGVVQIVGVPRHDVDLYPGLHMQIVIAIVLNSLGHALVQRRATEPDIGYLDHICGGVASGETPEEAGTREAREEAGVELRDVRRVHAGVNEYGRWRHLVVGFTDDTPNPNLAEVQSAEYLHPDVIREQHASGELPVVQGFFGDLDLALEGRTQGA